MKRTMTLIIVILLGFNISFSQSLQDTKDFIIEKIDANPPLPSYDNMIFFQNIIKIDAETFAGKKLTDTEFENLFIYGRDCYLDDSKTNLGWSIAQTIDIRGITKVSITRYTGEQNYYTITVYLSGNYYAKEFIHAGKKEPKWEYLDKMEILIGNNADAAQQIKKAIIHLGKLKGLEVKDGDLF